MRKEKALITMLNNLVSLLAEESASNPEFASKLNNLLSDLPVRKKAHAKKAKQKLDAVDIPDVHKMWNNLGKTDFQLWLRDQSIPVLRAVIRLEDFDPTHRTSKWKEVEKLADYIADYIDARQSRGSSFMGRSEKDLRT